MSVSSPGPSTGTDQEETPPARRPWLRRLAIGGLVGALGALSLPLVVVAPWVLDDARLDRVVKVVALDWRDFGEEKARERLEYELDQQSIGLQVGDDDCRLETDGSLRRVVCAWTVVQPIPGTDLTVPLAFGSSAEVAPDGDLR